MLNSVTKDKPREILNIKYTGNSEIGNGEGTYHDYNRLNNLTSKEWIKFQKSWFVVNPKSRKKNVMMHPAKFPEELIENFIRFFTKEGQTVFDPMVGTGSTLLAAMNTNRNAIGIELSKKYADVAAQRVNNESEMSRVIETAYDTAINNYTWHHMAKKLIEQINEVKIQYRGNKIKISGNKKSIFETKKTILNLFKEAQNGAEIDEDRIRDNKSLISMNIKSDKQMDLFIQTKKRKIIPRTEIQNKYLQLLNTKNITFAIGPAGTGKTYLAVAKAVSALQDGKVNKIILSRPAVEAGEKLGFLPGDLKEKVDPFLRPIYDALYSMLPYEQVKKIT